MSVPRTTIWPLEPHTEAKHAILRHYLEAWFPILSRYQGRVVYYDGYAGPGRYSEGQDGSPIIALKVALNHRSKLDAELVFVFVEEREDRAQHLERVEIPALGLPDKFKTLVRNADFETALASTLDTLDASAQAIAPTFAFIDPFGIKGLPFALIKRLLARKNCEVLITFMNDTIRRFVTELPEHVNALIGHPDAAAIIERSDDRIVAACQLYEGSLRTAAGFVRFFHIQDKDNRPLYDLFFASNSDLGHYRMKEAMWRADATGGYRFSDGIDPAQATLFTPDPGGELAPKLWQRFGGRTVDTVEILRHVRDETPYLEKHARAALGLLEEPRDGTACLISVAPMKADGKKRRGKSFAPGTLVTFAQLRRGS